MKMSNSEFHFGSRFRPLADGINKLLGAADKETIIVAIDGRCASGKTTLSGFLETEYGCNVFHMDDYFLRPEQRTGERLAAPGENVDHERFLEEILIPLRNNGDVLMRRYNCSTRCLESPVRVPRKRLNIVEGAYSLHPALFEYYDLTAFYDVDAGVQKDRIMKRNTDESAAGFFSLWIPLEEKYFRELHIKERAELLI